MPIGLKSKPCHRCDGEGAVKPAGSNKYEPCNKCRGSGRIPGKVARVFDDPNERRPIVLEIRAEGVYVRELGRRTVYGPLSASGLLTAGARLYVEGKRQEKAGRKAARRKTSRSLTRGR